MVKSFESIETLTGQLKNIDELKNWVILCIVGDDPTPEDQAIQHLGTITYLEIDYREIISSKDFTASEHNPFNDLLVKTGILKDWIISLANHREEASDQAVEQLKTIVDMEYYKKHEIEYRDELKPEPVLN